MSKINVYTIENEKIKLEILNIGSTIHQLYVKDKNGKWVPTLLEYEDIENYQTNPIYLNSVIGPYAGRIKDGRFTIDGKLFMLNQNDRGQLLHSGEDSLHNKFFEVIQYKQKIVSSYIEQDAFTGKVVYQIAYTLDGSKVKIEMQAIPSYTTIINMTQHTYFSLAQQETNSLEQKLKVDAHSAYMLDEHGVPTNIKDINNTAFDLHQSISIEELQKRNDLQFSITGHIDHPYVVDEWPITLCSNNLQVEVSSDAPDSVVYLTNTVDSALKFKYLGYMKRHIAVAVEPQRISTTQKFNRKEDNVYHKGEVFKRIIQYEFKLL